MSVEKEEKELMTVSFSLVIIYIVSMGGGKQFDFHIIILYFFFKYFLFFILLTTSLKTAYKCDGCLIL